MPDIGVIGVIALGLVVVALVVFGILQAKKRREALMAWASSNGLRYTRHKDHSFDERFAEFNCLRQGDNRYAYNICSGKLRGRGILAFDYHYETTSRDSDGKRSTTHHHFSAVIVRANLPLKPLMIRSENIFDRIGSAFGFDDIDFESAEFSRKFHVSAPDRRWAYDVLHTRTMQFLLEQPRHSIEFDSRYVIAWRSGRKSKPEDHEMAFELIEGILDRLPEYVKQQQQMDTTPLI